MSRMNTRKQVKLVQEGEFAAEYGRIFRLTPVTGY